MNSLCLRRWQTAFTHGIRRETRSLKNLVAAGFCLLLLTAPAGAGVLAGHHMVAAWKNLVPHGRLAATNELRLAISLPLRNPAELQALLSSLQNPGSPEYHHYLTPEEFTARFGPTETDYASLVAFAEANGLRVTEKHPNRLVLDVLAPAATVEKVFHVALLTYQHPREAREFFAPDAEPSVDTTTPILQVSGLDNYATRRPHFHRESGAATVAAGPRAGSGTNGTYLAKDLLNAYLPGLTGLNGAGQSVGLLQFDSFYTNDIKKYVSVSGITTTTKVVTVAVDGGVGSPGNGNGEVSLDIEMVLAMAPGTANIYVYEAPNPSPWVDLLSQMANDNKAKQLSCSWGDNTPAAPDVASEQIFAQMALQGQSFFNASGDSDAFVGGVPFPSESTNVTQVGATTLTTGSGASYISEQVWNWGITGTPKQDGVGSSGGVSTNFAIPPWQQGMNANLTSAGGSTTFRNTPDVAFAGDNVYSVGDNGSGGLTAGTSCAAPMWAGFMALVNQQNAANGQSPAGFINPAVYAIGKGANYASCFHDCTISSNTWTGSTTKFKAVTGYDLGTGWGTPRGTNLINALAPPATGPANIVSSPASQTNTYGAPVTFSVVASGAAPLAYQWFFNNAAVGGATSATLSFASIVSSNAGNYFVIVTNVSGNATSTVATLTVVTTPFITQPPQSQSVLNGQPVTFTVTAAGMPPLGYQWRKNSGNLPGQNATNYSIAGVSSLDAGNYDVVVTNSSGSVTSSVAVLTTHNIAAYSGVIVGWDMAGVTGFGSSPMLPTTNAPGVTVTTGLTRGAAFTTSGTAATGGWGGNGLNASSIATAISSGAYATFEFMGTAGYLLSLDHITHFDYRRSKTGATNGLFQFALDGINFSNLTTLSFPVTNTSGASALTLDLSVVPQLQNLPPGTNVTFRIVLQGATSTAGNWYIYNRSASTYANDFEITGSLSPVSVGQNPSAANSTLTVNPALTNVNQAVLITVTERDASNAALTNAGVAPVIGTSGGTLGAVTPAGLGVFTTTLTGTNAGYANITGTIGGVAIGNGAGARAYFMGTVPPVVSTPGFNPGTYNFVFSSAPGQSFSVFSSTNVALPVAQWKLDTDVAVSNNTNMTETIYVGQPSSYSFTIQPTNINIFYRIRTP